METFNITAPNETDKYTLTNNENVEIGDLPSLIGSDLLEINAIKNIEIVLHMDSTRPSADILSSMTWSTENEVNAKNTVITRETENK